MTLDLDRFLDVNPWRTDPNALNYPYFIRLVIPKIKDCLLTDEPILLKGGRGVGKTTLAKILIRDLLREGPQDPNNIFYFDLDDPLSADYFTGPERVLNFLRGFRPRDAAQLFLFVDEAQYLPAVTQTALSQEPQLKFIWTSSRASFVPTEPVPPRHWHHFSLDTCNLQEFLGATLRRKNYYLPELTPQTEILSTSQGYAGLLPPYLEEYLLYGGYPEIVQRTNPGYKPQALRTVLQNCLKSLSRDAPGIEEPDKFINLLTLLAQRCGQLLNLRELSRLLSLDHRTIKRYLKIMEEHYLVSLIYPFPVAAGQGVPPGHPVGVPLIYFYDSGLRNALVGSFNDLDRRPDRGVLLDNFIWRELVAWGIPRDLSFRRTAGGTVVFAFKLKESLYLVAVLYDFPRSKHGMKALVNLAQRIKPVRVIVLTRDYLPPGKYNLPNFIYLPTYWVWALPKVLPASE